MPRSTWLPTLPAYESFHTAFGYEPCRRNSCSTARNSGSVGDRGFVGGKRLSPEPQKTMWPTRAFSVAATSRRLFALSSRSTTRAEQQIPHPPPRRPLPRRDSVGESTREAVREVEADQDAIAGGGTLDQDLSHTLGRRCACGWVLDGRRLISAEEGDPDRRRSPAPRLRGAPVDRDVRLEQPHLAQRRHPFDDEPREPFAVDPDGYLPVRQTAAAAPVDVRSAASRVPPAVDREVCVADVDKPRDRDVGDRDRIVHRGSVELGIPRAMKARVEIHQLRDERPGAPAAAQLGSVGVGD